MIGLIRQYRTEIRNICIFTLVVILLPFLPNIVSAVLTKTGLILLTTFMGSLVLAMALKVYFRILVLRIKSDNSK